jgi:cellulose 1,4-beta-cellobiosidase
VLRSTVSGSGYASVATGVSTTSYTNTGLTNGTTYYFVVTATNSGGTSGNSNQASATPTNNLMLNPGYETGTVSPWVLNTGGIGGVTTTSPHSGSYCGYEGGAWSNLTQTIANLQANHTYTVTVWAKLSASTSSNITITANNFNNGSGSGSTHVTSTSWTQYTLQFTTGTTNLSSTNIGVWDNQNSTITCYVDDWTLN